MTPLPLVWLFNVVGTVDLIYAVTRGTLEQAAPGMGAWLFSQGAQDVKGIDIIVKKQPTGSSGVWTCWAETENRPCSDAEFRSSQERFRASTKIAAGPNRGATGAAVFAVGPNGALTCTTEGAGQDYWIRARLVGGDYGRETFDRREAVGAACSDAEIQALASVFAAKGGMTAQPVPLNPGRGSPVPAVQSPPTRVRAAPFGHNAPVPAAAVGIKNVGVGLGPIRSGAMVYFSTTEDGTTTGRVERPAGAGSRITMRDASDRIVARAPVRPDGTFRLPRSRTPLQQMATACIESPRVAPVCSEPGALSKAVTKAGAGGGQLLQ